MTALAGPTASHPGVLSSLKRLVAHRSRSKRADLFRQHIPLNSAEKVLDLGGGKGRHIAQHFPELRHVWIADHNPDALAYAREQFGFETVELDATNRLPFEDGEIEVVFCSSVIEHVTGAKDEAVALFKRDGRAFRTRAQQHQSQFAEEIRRIGKRYFVQTPNRYFPVEMHSWIPILGYLPTHLQWTVIRVFNRFWPRRDERPDWCLLTASDMKELFPDAEIHREKLLGITKSIIAIKR